MTSRNDLAQQPPQPGQDLASLPTVDGPVARRGVLRPPTSNGIAAVEQALEHRVAVPMNPDAVDVDRLRETFPAVHEQLLRQ